MVETKAKLTAKKVTVPKAKPKTPVAAASKPVAKVVASTPKKVVAKKKVAEVVETKQTKTPVVKKVSAATEKTKVPAKKAATTKTRASAIGAKEVNKTAKENKPSPEERYRMIETAAYFIAEQHGFQGRSDAHWVAAERQIAAKLGE